MHPFMDIRSLTPPVGRMKCIWVPAADGQLESVWVPDWDQDAMSTEPVRKAS